MKKTISGKKGMGYCFHILASQGLATTRGLINQATTRKCFNTGALSFVLTVVRMIVIGTVCAILMGTVPVNAGNSLHYVNHWHIHQPIYWPNQSRSGVMRWELAPESIDNQGNGPWVGHPANNLSDIFGLDDRKAAYQYRPKDALGTISGYPEAGFTISYTGSLAENVNALGAQYRLGYSPGWKDPWREARGWMTSGGKTRMDILLTGFHHNFFPLLPDETLARRYIQVYKALYSEWWGSNVPMSVGFWPLESAFSTRNIPALLAEGVQWTIVSNSHISRAYPEWPATPGNGMVTEPPNKADQRNSFPQGYTPRWRSGNIDGRRSTNELRYSYRPRWTQYIDPETGTASKIIAVPMADYESYVDGYQSFGVDLFDDIAGAQESGKPALVLLAHDGDNAWGGGFDSYMTNTPSKASGASSKGYTPGQVSQYLADHPVDVNDVVHIEDGPWVNADGDFGSPTFSNWNWPWIDPRGTGQYPIFDPTKWDDNSQFWGITTALANRALTAEQKHGSAPDPYKIGRPETGGNNLEYAWHYLLGYGDSGHIYYGTASDFSFIPVVVGNKSAEYSDAVLGYSGELPSGFSETVPPTIWVPQRFPYNPGGSNFGCAYKYQSWTYPSNFHIYTFVYDASGLNYVKVKYRTATGGNEAPLYPDNFTYSGGSGVGAWQEIVMSSSVWATRVYLNNTLQDPPPVTPTYMPLRYWAEVNAGTNKLLDYYVEAQDKKGNIRKSPIQHVWVGAAGSQQESSGLWVPSSPTADNVITVFSSQIKPGKFHWGVNDWTQPSSEYWPSNSTTTVYNVQSVQTRLLFNGASYYINIGPFAGSQAVTKINFVFNYDDGTWDNNGGANWSITLSPVDDQPPAAPEGLTATSKNQQIDLSWQPVPGVSGYNLYKWDVSTITPNNPSLITWTTGYSISALLNGTTYTFSVTAVKATGTNPESLHSSPASAFPLASDNVPTSSPQGLNASAGIQSANLSWTANIETDLYGYKIYRAETSGALGTKTLVTTILKPGTTHQDAGLTAGTTYYYQLTSRDAAGNESSGTSEKSVLAQSVQPPATPSGLSGTASNQKIDLRWNANTEQDLGGYNLYCSSSGIYFKVNPSLITGATTYSHTGLTNGGTYYYKLTAVNTSGGESGYSSSVSARPMDLVEVVFYADMRAVSNVTSVAVAQDTMAPLWNATHYALVQLSGDYQGIWRGTINIAQGTALKYKFAMNGNTWESDFGTAPDNNRSITISPNNGVQMYVANKWNIAQDAVPAIPAGLAAESKSYGILLRWTANTEYDLQKYNIYRSQTDGGYQYYLSASSVTYIIGNLTPGTTYYFKVEALDLANQSSGVSGSVNAVAGLDPPPASPSGVSAAAKNTAIDIRWTANSEADLAGYFVSWGVSNNGPYPSSSGLLSSATTFFSISGLTNGTTYYVVVKASDTAGSISSASSQVSGSPNPVPEYTEINIDGNFLDWAYSDVRALDSCEDAYVFNDGYDSSRDIVALYSREGQNNYYFRVDFHELGVFAENASLDMYFMLDFAAGGQQWFPDFSDTQTDTPWDFGICIYNAASYKVYNSQYQELTGVMQGVSINSALDSMEFAVSKSALVTAGWSAGSAINIQCYTTKDGMNGGAGEISGSDIADAIGATIDRSGGFLRGAVSSTASTGRAKYGFIYHGNQSINLSKDIQDWVERYEAAGSATDRTGYIRGLDTIDAYGVKGNLHISGCLGSVLKWAKPDFVNRIKTMLSAGKVKLLGGALAEHMLPYYENDSQTGVFVNSKSIRQRDNLMRDIYGLSATPKVFWTPERVIRGQTFSNILYYDANVSSPTGYTATCLDDKYHIMDWFYGGSLSSLGQNRFKLHKINGVTCFLINGVKVGAEERPGDNNQLTYGYYDPDGAKFWNQDGGLHIGTRKLLLERAQDADQEKLVLVFDDWEAYAGRSFTSALPNPNPDNWDKTIKWIANKQWIETVTLEDILSRNWTPIDHGTDTGLPVKTYCWLTRAVEGAYDNWYWGSSQEESFSNRVPKVRGTVSGGTALPSGKSYGHINTVGTIMRDAWDAVKNAPDNQLKEYASMVYNTMIYETAWHDEQGEKWDGADTSYDGISGWALYLHGHARYAVIVSSAAKWAGEVLGGKWTTAGVYAADIDLDGEQEYILKNDKVFAVFERIGGRMLMGFAYDSTAGGFQLIGTPVTNYEYEGEETSQKHTTAFRDSNNDAYHNTLYNATVHNSSVTFKSSDNNITKIFSLSGENITAAYSENLSGALYIRFGMVPNAYDMFHKGKSNVVAISSAPTVGYRNLSGGQVTLTFSSGVTLNTGYSDGTADNTNNPHAYAMELYGDGNFTITMRLSGTGAVDTTAPGAITNLVASTGSNDGEINIAWTAPGDNGYTGNNGATALYIVRYSTYAPSGNISTWFDQGGAYLQVWTVSAAGVTENRTLSGFAKGTRYYIGIKTRDEAGNLSGINIAASAETPPDSVSPNRITTLQAASGVTDGTVLISWIAPGDDGTTGTAREYLVKLSSYISESPAINNTKFDAAIFVSLFSPVPVPQAFGTTQNMNVTGLTPGLTYYFAMKAKDATIWSELSNGATAMAKIDNISPSNITDLFVSQGISAGEVRLRWTAPGNDGTAGTAFAYSIRISSLSNIADNTAFNQARPLTVLASGTVPSPSVYNTVQTMEVSSLVPGVTYWFSIRASDERGNMGTWVSDSSFNVLNFARAGISGAGSFTGTAVSASSLLWNWTDVSGETGYQLTTDSGGAVSSVLSVNLTYYIETGLSVNTKHIRRIKTLFNDISSLSGSATAWTLANPPSGSSVSAGPAALSLNWNNNNNSSGTGIELRKAVSSPITAAVSVLTTVTAPVTYYIDSAITEGVTYYYRLRAVNGASVATAFDSEITVIISRAAPAAITNITAETGSSGGTVSLSWYAPREDGDTGGAVSSYIIKYSLSDFNESGWSSANTASSPPSPLTPGQRQTVTVGGLTQGTRYYFRVKSADDAGNISLIDQTATAANAIAKMEEVLPKPPIYIAFLWHMHQPIYYPYESPGTIDANGRFSFSVQEVINGRGGPYNPWPKGAVEKGLGLKHLGAQMSFSGSLMENLNNMWGSDWRNNHITARNWKTEAESSILPGASSAGGGNPRLDIIGFGYHHPLMGLVHPSDVRRQIQMHRQMVANTFGSSPGYSKGIFPPENAFRPEMIPALVDEGIQWAIIDNIHFDRAVKGYPWSSGGNLYEPNPSDQINEPSGLNWLQLSGIWAGTKVSAPWGYKPHYVAYTDPATGVTKKMIAVPGARYEGNEDARGGFGALQYETVMSQYEQYNTDARHPMLVVLPHDGDNYGGGTEAYYGSNFQEFVNWLYANPTRFVCTTIQDYVDMFPPDENDIIHVENGSWSGADNGDPEFLKWNGAPGADGYSYDRNSWAIMTAAKNRLDTAESITPASSINDILNNTGNDTAKAWRYYYVGQTSCYWYWDGTEIWDSNPARAANMACSLADPVIGSSPNDTVGPAIYIPQRTPYNPGGTMWGIAQPSDFTVWTFVYDLSGLSSVKLKYRIDPDGVRDSSNNLYSGGSWTENSMTQRDFSSRTNPLPTYKASEYSSLVTGQGGKLIDYYVEATDTKGNIAKSPVLHVFVGGSGPTPTTLWSPTNPTTSDVITIRASVENKPGKLHWGVNNWVAPNSVYWPANSTTTVYGTNGQSVQTVLLSTESGKYFIQVGPFNNPLQQVSRMDFVFAWADGSWDSNNNQNWTLYIASASEVPQVSITYPSQNYSVSVSSLDLSAQATDDKGISAVGFFYRSTDTVNWVFISSTSQSGSSGQYVYSWDVSGLSEDRDYILTARVQDADGNAGTSSEVRIKINRINAAPLITLIYPAGGEAWTGNRNVVYTASDPDGDTLRISVQQKLNREGEIWTSAASNELNTGTYTWNTTLLSNSTMYMLRLFASDPGNATGLAVSNPFTLRNYPGTLTDLVASTLETGIKLQWTSSGEDWEAGTCTGYDIRYSTAENTSPAASITKFNQAASVSVLSPGPAPQISGTVQSLTATGLVSGVTYYFAIRAKDEVPLWSALSNGATAMTLTDNISPAVVTTLSAQSVSAGSCQLSWLAPGDDGTAGNLINGSFVIKYSTNSMDNWSSVVSMNIPASGINPGAGQVQSIGNLIAGSTYYFCLKTTDDAGNISGLSNGATVWIRQGVTYRSIVVDGNITGWLSPEENLGTRFGNTFYFTWSADTIYIAYSGPDANTAANDLFVLFDTDFAVNSGTTSPVTNWDGVENHILPFYADYALCVEGSAYRALRNWSGSAWNDPGNGQGIVSDSLGATVNEISILRSSLGSPSRIRMLFFHKWDTQKNIYNSYPEENPAPGTDTSVRFTHYYDILLNEGINPSEAAVTSDIDATPPAKITVFSATPGSPPGSIDLSWNSPGDDGEAGNLTGKYRLDYSTYTAYSWPATNYKIEISTGNCPPASTINYRASNLIPGATYYFRVKTADEQPNWSEISVGATGYALPDNIAPSKIENLSAIPGASAGQVILTWTAPGNDGTTGISDSYVIKYSTVQENAPAVSEVKFNDAGTVQVFSPVPAPLSYGISQTMVITGLLEGATYYFAVKSRDISGNSGTLSNGATSYAKAGGVQDSFPPAQVSDLSAATGATQGQIILTWSAPGNDGTSGNNTAGARYELKYATYSVSALGGNTTNWWSYAALYPQSWQVLSRNEAETHTVTLSGATTFYFALKTYDASGNVSIIDLNSQTVGSAGGDLKKEAELGTVSGGSKQESGSSPGSYSGSGSTLLDSNGDYAEVVIPAGTWTLQMRYSTTSDGLQIEWSKGGASGYGDNVTNTGGAWQMRNEPRNWNPWNGTDKLRLKINSSDRTAYIDYILVPGGEGGGISAQACAVSVAETDITGPGAINNLIALPGSASGEVLLYWTTTGDNNNSGNISGGKYRIDYATGTKTWSVNLYKIEFQTSSISGAAVSYKVAGLTQGSTYYFKVYLGDEVPNWSEASNLASSYALPQPSPAASFTPVLDSSKDSSWGAKPNSESELSKNPDNRAKALYITNDKQYLFIGYEFSGDPWNDDGLSANYGFFFDKNTASGTGTDPWVPATTTIGWSNKPDVAVNGWVNSQGTTPKALGGMLRYVSDGTNWGTSQAMLNDDFASNTDNNWAEFRIPLSIMGVTEGQTINIVQIFRPAENKVGISDSTPYDAAACSDWGNSSANVTAYFTYTVQEPPDITPPAAVTSLYAVPGSSEGYINLFWTTPGDDGNSGNLLSGSKVLLQYSVTSGVIWSTASAQKEITLSNIPPSTLITHTLDGLAAGATYYFRIWVMDESLNVSGESNAATSLPQVDTLPPAAVNDLSAFTGASSGRINLGWTVTGDDNYLNPIVNGFAGIDYSSSSAFSPVSTVLISTTVSAGVRCIYILTGMESGLVYYFKIRLADERQNWSAYSSTATGWAPFDNVAPLAVTDLSLLNFTAVSGIAALRWTSPGDDGGEGVLSGGMYEVRFSSGSSLLSADYSSIFISTTCLPGTIQTINLTGITGYATYYFAVRTGDEEIVPSKQRNWSDFSNIVSTRAVDITPPSAISDLFVRAGISEGEIFINWTSPGDDGTAGALLSGSKWQIIFDSSQFIVDGSQIIISTGGINPGTVISYSLTGLIRGTSYYLGLKLSDEAGNWSELSNITTGYALDLAPLSPSAITAVAGSGEVLIQWTASVPEDFSHYVVYYDTVPPYSFSENLAATQTVNTAFTHLGLVNDVTHYYRVTVADLGPAVLESLPSDTVYAVPSTNTPPVPPSSFSGTALGTGSIGFTWTDNSSNETGFRLYSSTGGLIITLPAGTETWPEEGLGRNTSSYIYQVAAVNSAGESQRIQAEIHPLFTLAAAPEELAFGGIYLSSAVLAWTNAGNPPWSRYGIAVSSDNFLSYVSTTVGWSTALTTNTYTVNLIEDTTNHFRVWAYNGNGITTSFTGVISTRAADLTPPEAVSGFIACTGNTDGEVRLVWISPGDNGLSGILEAGSKWQLYYSTVVAQFIEQIEVSTAGISPGTGISYTLTGLIPGVSYYFRLRVSDEAGNWSALSNIATGYAQDLVPPVPLSLVAQSSMTVINLSWSITGGVLPGDFLYYRVYCDSTVPDDFLDGFITTQTVSASFIHSGLTSGLTYSYRISSVDRGPLTLESGFAEMKAFTNVSRPLAPAGFTGAAVSTTVIRFAWTDNSINEDGFLLYSSTGGLLLSLPQNTTEYLHTGLSADTSSYIYQVAVFNSAGESSRITAEIQPLFTLAAAPQEPAFGGIYVSSVVLTWNSAGNPSRTRYGLSVSSDNFSAYISTVAGWSSALTENTYIANLIENATNYFRVWAYNGNGIETANSYTISHRAGDITVPTAPTAFSGIAVSSTAVLFTWQDNSSNETGFRLYSSSGVFRELTADTTQYIVSGLLPDTSAPVLSVAAYRFLESSRLEISSAVYSLAAAPRDFSAPQVFRNMAGLVWTSNNPAYTNFGLKLRPENIAEYSEIIGFNDYFTALSTMVARLNENTLYYFKVYAFNRNGVKSEENYLIVGTSVTRKLNEPGTAYFEEVTDSASGLVVRVSVSSGVFLSEYTGVSIRKRPETESIILSANKASGNIAVGAAYEFDIYDVNGSTKTALFPSDVTLSFSFPAWYSVSQKSALRIYKLVTGSWQAQDNFRLDMINNLIMLDTRSFSTYRVMMTPGDTGNIVPYPNPFRPARYPELVFDRFPMTDETEIKIFNVAGELVYERAWSANELSGRGSWNAKNNDGRDVATGIYIYLIKQGTSQVSKGMISVIQ